MKTKPILLKLSAVCACVVAPMLASAQSVPPSCQRYVTAFKVCGRDLVRYEEQLQPEQAPKMKSQLADSMNGLTSAIQKAVREHGTEATAKVCASPSFSSQVVPKVTNLMTALSFGDAASEGCQEAYGRLVLPTLTQ